jgi:hypothetical protein
VGVAHIHLTRSTDATVYVALDLAIVAAVVVRCGAGWEARCYYGPDEYEATIATSRETAEADALRYAIRLAGPVEAVRRD